MKWKELLESMSALDLHDLENAMSLERDKRIQAAVPKMPRLFPAELQFLNDGNKLKAIKAYRERVGCTLRQSKAKIDDEFDRLVTEGHRKANPQ